MISLPSQHVNLFKARYRPVMMFSPDLEQLRHQLRLRMANCSLREVAELMGYKRPGRKVRERLHNLLEDPMLGLDRAAYDFRYTDAEFLRRLCEVTGADLALCRKVLRDYDEYNTRRLHAWPAVIFIDTPPKSRGGHPLFALALMQSRRFIPLTIEQRLWPLARQVEWVRERVRRHYRENQGRIEFWGEIRRYMFSYQKDSWLELDTAGNVVAEHRGWQPPLASVRVGGGGGDLSSIIKL